MEDTEASPAGIVLPSLPRRFIDVFFSPGRLFEALRHRPVWAGALVVGAVLVGVSAVLIPVEAWQSMMEEQIRARGAEMPGNLDTAANVTRIFGVAGGVVFWFVWAFLVAGLLTLVFSFLLGDDGRYKQYLAIAAHALLIPAVGALLTVPLKIAQANPQVTLSVGTFAGFLEDGYLKRVLDLLDLFQLWSWVVMGLGVAMLSTKRTWSSAALILLGFAVVLALVFAIFTG